MPLSSHSSLCLSQPLATTNRLSVSVDLPALDVSCKWSHTLCGLLGYLSIYLSLYFLPTMFCSSRGSVYSQVLYSLWCYCKWNCFLHFRIARCWCVKTRKGFLCLDLVPYDPKRVFFPRGLDLSTKVRLPLGPKMLLSLGSSGDRRVLLESQAFLS